MEEETDFDLKNYSIEENTLYMYTQNNREEAIRMFSQETPEKRKSLVHAFLKIHDYSQRYPRDQEAHNFYFKISIFSRKYKEIFITDSNYSDYVFEYFHHNKFKKLNSFETSFFSNVKTSNKENFLKLLKIHPCPDFLLNNLSFDFNKEDTEEIKKIINKHFRFNEIKDKMNIINKIGYYDTFLYIDFNENTNKEYFDLFFDNIDKFDNEKLLKITINNFFLEFFWKNKSIDSFRSEEFSHLYKLRPEVCHRIKDLLKNENKEELKNILELIKLQDDKLKIISERVNNLIIIENF